MEPNDRQTAIMSPVQMTLADDIARSRDFEMETYLESMKAMYENALLQNGEVYDIAFKLTNGFADISEASILQDSRIIKTLRYSVTPTISQMKFGQYVGLSSVDRFERDKLSPGKAAYRLLASRARAITEFARRNLDTRRFIWLTSRTPSSELAREYAKKWTCSLAADQNAQTAYRNWRKERQEQAIVAQIVKLRYVKSTFSGIVSRKADVNIGEYLTETRVKGRTTQKADVLLRSKGTGKLVLIEAKAVGVEIDATKRTKECCDKANDWGTAPALDSPMVVAVIAGFFTETNIASLKSSHVQIVWEHRLQDLAPMS